MSAVPLGEVQAHLQMTAGSNPELQQFIDVAEAAIGHRVGPLTPEERVEKYDGGRTCIILRSPVAESITAISYADGTASTLADYDLDTATGIVYWNSGTGGIFPGGPRNVTITYEAGWGVVPEDLRQAVKELVRHLWETQRGNNSSRPGFTDEPPVPGAYSSWPTRVQELVGPYSAPKVA